MANHIREQIDLLCSLRLPDRFEPLFDLVGENITKILVQPPENLVRSQQSVIDHIKVSSQGCLLPLAGESGAGKTTFAWSANQWFAKDVAQTISYTDQISYDGLKAAVDRARQDYPTNDSRIIPINIDHRESDPPSTAELAQIKRFLRTSPSGCKNIIFWPETDASIAHKIGDDYKKIAGAQPQSVLTVFGPDRQIWQNIAINTLRLSNDMSSLENIGVDPRLYDPHEYPSLGEFMKKIHFDFRAVLTNLRASISKAVVLVIVFVSESGDPGVLNFVSSGGRHGLLDAQGLLASTPESAIGKWWSTRQGLLVRAIVQLNAHALFLSPPITMSALRNFGPVSDVLLGSLGIPRTGPARAVTDLERSDIGKILQGQPLKRYEGRGNPAASAITAFQKLGDQGFNLGADKRLNAIMAAGWAALLKAKKIEIESVNSEKALDFCPGIIPDNSVVYTDTVFCIEYTWRKGDYLANKNRSAVAQYTLTKLKNYVRELGWAAD